MREGACKASPLLLLLHIDTDQLILASPCSHVAALVAALVAPDRHPPRI